MINSTALMYAVSSKEAAERTAQASGQMQLAAESSERASQTANYLAIRFLEQWAAGVASDYNRNKALPDALNQYDVYLLLRSGFGTIDDLLARASELVHKYWRENYGSAAQMPWVIEQDFSYDDDSSGNQVLRFVKRQKVA